MNNFAELKFEPIAGNAYNVECSLGIEGQRPAVIIARQVPAFDPSQYLRYRQACRRYELTRLGLGRTSVTTQADLDRISQEVKASAEDLLCSFNQWGNLPELPKSPKRSPIDLRIYG